MRKFWLISLLAFGIAGCGDDEEPEDTQPEDTDIGDLEVYDCTQHEFQGQVYDCDTLDRCDPNRNLTHQLACCDCDPIYCAADPTCPPDPDEPPPPPPPPGVESCMSCHNGSQYNDYSGSGITNPHPFAGALFLKCSDCHGGDPTAQGKNEAHVPAPPQIGTLQNQQINEEAWYNRRTLIGIDKYPDYTAPNGRTYTSLEYLQFINPGDLRVVAEGNSCGTNGCHGGEHAEWFPRSVIANGVGIYSGTMFGFGSPNKAGYVGQNYYGDTAADYGPRQRTDPNWTLNPSETGRVGQLLEFPEHGTWGDTAGIYQNQVYNSATLANFVYNANEDVSKTNQVKPNSPLEDLLHQTVSFACGDCHGTSAGQNDRYADFRSAGCSGCHMEYSWDGRSRSADPHVNKFEPANPDAIAAPERAHVRDHQIRNVVRVVPGGGLTQGISDKVCMGCHQGSNRTVQQFWGARIDQNQNLNNNVQYPANPVTFQDATGDARFFDPTVGNQTFNGRIAEQIIIFEDYDGDGRNDIPADIHHEAGMGCIDCHGSRDLHGGTDGDSSSGWILSRQDQAVSIQCESCHGSVDTYAPTVPCTDYTGQAASCATDRRGNALRHVTVDGFGNFYLRSKVSGNTMFIPQTRDTTVNNNKFHPTTGQAIYSPLASYAMGRADGNPATGVGPIQDDPTQYQTGFSHTDNLSCTTCHASWSQNCIGCHLELSYDDNPANYFFSNTTGERISTFVSAADFVYQTPVLFQLGVSSRNQIVQNPTGMKVFWRYVDINGVTSDVFNFSDRLGGGNNPNYNNRGDFGAGQHDKMTPHTIRGRVTNTDEGPRYCVACHLTTEALDNFGAEYDVFRNALDNRDYDQLDFNLLQEHIGQNPGNQLNSPFFVHMVAGLGTGLFLFDEEGCPVNPLDNDANRFNCANGAPADNFDLNNVAYDMDKVVEATGIANAGNSHPLNIGFSGLRGGSIDPNMSGPMGVQLLQKIADPDFGVVLDGWIDADGIPQGSAPDIIQ